VRLASVAPEGNSTPGSVVVWKEQIDIEEHHG
jgi:hypothetical protein